MKTEVFYVLLLLILGLIGYHYREFIFHEIFLYMSGDSTIYSKGYSEELFDEVQIGQSLQEVTKKLAAPLEQDQFQNNNGDTVIVFEYSSGSHDYRRRLIFFIDDKVSSKDKSIHID